MAEKAARVNTLAYLLEQHGYIPEPQVLHIFVQILRDLEQHHSQAELHLDIKPQNIVRGAGGVFRLTGYGESRLGTPRYMAPERCRRGKPDARSDLYSLGVVLFEAATGRPLFDTNLNYELLQAHLTKRQPAPQSIRPEISAELQRIILTALAKDPSDRFQSAREFREALEQLARVQSAERTPASARTTTQVSVEKEKVLTESRTGGVAPAKTVGEAKMPDSRGRRAAVVVWLLSAVVVVVLGGLSFLLFGMGTKRQVPRLVGLSLTAAESLAQRRNLVVAVAGEEDGSMAAGLVAGQSPRAGTKLRLRDTVKVWISSGMAKIPAFANRSLEEASKELMRLGIVVSRVDSVYSDAVQPGFVVNTIPPTPARLKAGSSLVIAVAAGKATCPSCGLRREKGAKFCIRCGYKYEP